MGKIQRVLIIVIMILAGAAFMAFGVYSALQPEKATVTVKAQIVDIQEEPDAVNDTTEYHVFVDYTDADGKEHKNVEYPGYDSGMKVGDTIEIKYNAENPEELISSGKYVDYIFVAVGAAVVAFAVYNIIAVKKMAVINSRINAENVRLVEEEGAGVVPFGSAGSVEAEYYYHYNGRLNQSQILETPQREIVYEAQCGKMGVIGANRFTFVDHRTGASAEHVVSHTITNEFGGYKADGAYTAPTSSKFKIDDTDCWKYLRDLGGYSIVPHIDGFKINFDVTKYGVKVAEIRSAGTEVISEKHENSKLGRIPVSGLYKVYCRDEDLEAVFFAAFICSRVEFI